MTFAISYSVSSQRRMFHHYIRSFALIRPHREMCAWLQIEMEKKYLWIIRISNEANGGGSRHSFNLAD